MHPLRARMLSYTVQQYCHYHTREKWSICPQYCILLMLSLLKHPVVSHTPLLRLFSPQTRILASFMQVFSLEQYPHLLFIFLKWQHPPLYLEGVQTNSKVEKIVQEMPRFMNCYYYLLHMLCHLAYNNLYFPVASEEVADVMASYP